MTTIDWLTGAQIEHYIKCNADEDTKRLYVGVFSSNTLPRKVDNYPLLLIVNSDSSNLAGKQWRAVYIAENLHGEVFDPLGVPINLWLERWMNTFCIKWTRTQTFIQHPLSPSCGAFVLHFVLNRFHVDSLHSYILSNYDDNLSKNVMRIKNYVHSLRK